MPPNVLPREKTAPLRDTKNHGKGIRAASAGGGIRPKYSDEKFISKE